MKLRMKLLLAFLLLAVVPLATISLYSYNSSQRALRQAAEAESERLAADLGDRMQAVSEDLSRRIERVAGLPFRALMSPRRPEGHEQANELVHQLMAQMGDTASFIKAFEFTPTHPPVPPSMPVHPRTPSEQAPATKEEQPSGIVIDLSGTPPIEAAGEVQPRMERGRMTLHVGTPPAPPPPPGAGVPPDQERGTGEAANKKEIELAQRLAKHMEAIRRTAVAQAAKALEARKKELLYVPGRGFDTEVRSGGELVGSLRAEVSTQRILRHVLSKSQRAEGEIPFAVDSEGKIHAANPEDIPKIEALPLPPSIHIATGDSRKVDASQNWVVVTRKDEHSGVIFGIARPIGDRLGELRRTAARNLAYGLGAVGIALIGIIPLTGRMTRNLTVLTRGAEQLAQGNLQTRVEIKSRDEFGQLAQAFNRMARDLSDHEKHMVEQERLRKELEMCRKIQEELLPRHALRTGLVEIKGVSIPAREVGGDFFNYFSLPDGDVAVLVGDVSGKGLPAALLMANLQATIQARLPLELDLAKLATQLDTEIDSNTPPELYLTVFIAILETRTHTMRYVNAGHNAQFALRGGGLVERLESTGRPLGLLPGGSYGENRVSLNHGDALFFYTDGLVEAENEAGEEFGTSRLEALVLAEQQSGNGGVLSRIEAAIRAYRGSVEAADDATMMLVRIGPVQD
ncbi:MAG TPA: SpoIIE family protein phosphatase [Acidobacteriota bacterium]|nr:SpoIIE family protein phosphatase [Acidobacteriota bacterium]